jgi:hypothetical protein
VRTGARGGWQAAREGAGKAAGAAGKALAAGNLPAALAALNAAREQAAQGWRAIKAAATGRHARNSLRCQQSLGTGDTYRWETATDAQVAAYPG